MTRSPSFQFYPSDWMTGAPATMSPDETHVYIWMICKDWTQSGFTFEIQECAKWCRLPRRRFVKAWERVRLSFVERDGRMYNPRLDKERAKQEEWRRKSAEGGRTSAAHKAQGSLKGGSRVVEPTGNTSVFSLQSSDPVTTTSAAGVAEMAIELTRTANAAISARFGEQPNPLRAGHGPSHELAQTVLDAGIPVDVALRSVARQAALLKEPIGTMWYFQKGIMRDWSKANDNSSKSLVDALLAPTGTESL